MIPLLQDVHLVSFVKKCKYFPSSEDVHNGIVKPCATGIMSLTLRADGLLSPCRLCPEEVVYINNMNKYNQLTRIVDKFLSAYNECFHMTI